MDQQAHKTCQLSAAKDELPLQNHDSDTSWDEETIAAWIERAPTAASLDQWIHWNNSPLRHASEEVLASFFPVPFGRMFLSDPLVSAHVDGLLRSRLSWSSPVRWAPQDPLWDVAMLSPDCLKRLALLSASFSMKREISQVIDGSMARRLRAYIGEDIFQFVLLSNASLKYFLEPLHAALSTVSDITAALHQGGVMIVQQAFSSKERGIQERLSTKFSGCFAQGYCDTPLPWALQAEQVLSRLWKEAGSWL